MTEHIKQMLNELAEYQAQIDALELRKQELLNEVKVPAEVLAVQDEANRRRQKADSDALKIQKEIQATTALLMSEIVEPELPAEYVAAMAAARAQREDIQSQAASRYERLQKKNEELKAQIDAELQAQVRDVFAQVEQRRQEIAAEFEGKAESAIDNMAALTEKIKAEVIKAKKSVKGDYYNAIYVKGRVTWNTEVLEGLAMVIPDVLKARKEGAPSVSLRKV